MPLQEDHAFNAGSLIRGTNRADFIAESLCVSKKKENEREEQMNDTLEERGHRTVYTQMFPVHLSLSLSLSLFNRLNSASTVRSGFFAHVLYLLE